MKIVPLANLHEPTDLSRLVCDIFEDDRLQFHSRTALSGGCIFQTARLVFSRSSTRGKPEKVSFVIKEAQTASQARTLAAEANGLLALRAVIKAAHIDGLSVPKPYALATSRPPPTSTGNAKTSHPQIPSEDTSSRQSSSKSSFLLMEDLGEERLEQDAPGAETALGVALAKLHRFTDWSVFASDHEASAELPEDLRNGLSSFRGVAQSIQHPNTAQPHSLKHPTFGWYEDNFPDKPHKKNFPPSPQWVPFFREYRLRPLLERTYADGKLSLSLRKQGETLLKDLEQYLDEPPQASLVHGDMWSGNVMLLGKNHAALIDPAIHLSHYESDIALSELFGRRGRAFYAAYHETFPLSPQYAERTPLYNLYHLLNHLHLFGASYLPGVKTIIQRYTSH